MSLHFSQFMLTLCVLCIGCILWYTTISHRWVNVGPWLLGYISCIPLAVCRYEIVASESSSNLIHHACIQFNTALNLPTLCTCILVLFSPRSTVGSTKYGKFAVGTCLSVHSGIDQNGGDLGWKLIKKHIINSSSIRTVLQKLKVIY